MTQKSKSKTAKQLVPPTDAEIASELAILQDYAPRIRQRNAFGDSNRDLIDSEILVLNLRMTQAQVEDKTWSIHEERDSDMRFAAQGAYDWLVGKSQEKPSDGWKNLLES